MIRNSYTAVAAAVGTLALFSVPTAAQEAPSEAPPAPSQEAPAPDAAAKSLEEPKAASECKGLEEKPCRKNKLCTWIIPKDPNKSGEVPPAYCRKLGPTRKKAKDAAPPPTAPPAAPSP